MIFLMILIALFLVFENMTFETPYQRWLDSKFLATSYQCFQLECSLVDGVFLLFFLEFSQSPLAQFPSFHLAVISQLAFGRLCVKVLDGDIPQGKLSEKTLSKQGQIHMRTKQFAFLQVPLHQY